MNSSKVSVVVGVGPELGAAIAHRFSQEDFTVALMARKIDKLASIQQAIEASGARALSVAVDATDPDSVKAAFGQVQARLGYLDGVGNRTPNPPAGYYW